MSLKVQITIGMLTAFLIFLALCIVLGTVAEARMLDPDSSHASYIVGAIQGTLRRPFVYRTLLPTVANALTSVTPAGLQQLITQLFLPGGIISSSSPYAILAIINPTSLYPAVLVIAMMCTSLVVYGFTLQKLYLRFFSGNRIIALIIAVLGLVAIVPFIDANAKLYDFPVLALNALCLLYMYERKWVKYLICFGLACINKETTFLQIGLLLLAYHANPQDRSYRNIILLQIAMYIDILAIIHHVYAANEGFNFYFRPEAIAAMMFRDLHSPVHILSIILLYCSISNRWVEIPLVLRQSLWLLPVIICLYYLCGRMLEYRVFYDVFPYLTLMAGHGIFNSRCIMKEPANI